MEDHERAMSNIGLSKINEDEYFTSFENSLNYQKNDQNWNDYDLNELNNFKTRQTLKPNYDNEMNDSYNELNDIKEIFNNKQDNTLINPNHHKEEKTFTNQSIIEYNIEEINKLKKNLSDNSKLSNDKLNDENIKNQNNAIFSLTKTKRNYKKKEKENIEILIKNEDTNNIKNKKRHNKYSEDNIMKKIKCLFLKYLIITINSLVEKYKTNKEIDYTLKKLKYKYSEHLNTKSDLELLQKPIKDMLSKEISTKCISPPDSNKKTIENLLKDEKNNIIIQEILKITFSEWIYLFKKKKGKLINGTKIIFKGIETVYKKIEKKNKNDEKYISQFKKCLNKYEEWFKKKKPRKGRNHFI